MSAESVFIKHALDLGVVASGFQSISLDYTLIYNSGTNAKGWGRIWLCLNIVDPPVGSAMNTLAILKASTWIMMLLGFLGVGLASYRRLGRLAFRLA